MESTGSYPPILVVGEAKSRRFNNKKKKICEACCDGNAGFNKKMAPTKAKRRFLIAQSSNQCNISSTKRFLL